MGITTSESSALSNFSPLIFEMQLINGALFLNTTVLFLFALSELVTFFFHFLVRNFGKSLSSKVVSRKYATF